MLLVIDLEKGFKCSDSKEICGLEGLEMQEAVLLPVKGGGEEKR